MHDCKCPTCGQSLPPDLLAIDRDAGIVVGNGRFAHLTNQEFRIFEALYDSNGRVQSKEQLLRAIAPLVDDEPEIKIVDVFVCKIRKKINGLGISIDTAWARGYRMNRKEQSHE